MSGVSDIESRSAPIFLNQVQGLVRLARPHRKRLYLTFIFVIGFGLWEGVVLSAALPVLNGIVATTGDIEQRPSGFFGAVFNVYESIPEDTRASVGIILLMAMEIVRAAVSYVALVFQSTLATSVTVTRRSHILSNLMSARLSFFDRTRSGYLFQVTSTEMVFLADGISSLVALFATFTRALITVVIMLLLSWQLVLVLALFFGINGLITIFLGGRIQRNADIALGGRTALMTDLHEASETIRQHKSLGTEDTALNKMNAASSLADWTTRRQKLLTSALSPITMAVGLVAIATVVVVSANFDVFSTGEAGVASLLLFLLLMLRLAPVISGVAGHYANVKGVGPSLDKVNALIFMSPNDIEDVGGARPNPLFQHDISYENVDFSYDDNTHILRDINLRITAGQSVAIVGLSGSGKSTLVDLLARFYEPQSGAIRFDGIDAREVDVRYLRQQIGYVSQETVLFTDTVKENIRAARLSAEMGEIVDAAKRANAHEFILKLPNGYDTVLGERGSTLSEGQRQRIAIAQVFLKDPALLVLDEPTSALDPDSEMQVLRAVEDLSAGRTVLTVAHRLATIQNADLIIVLKAGEIVESGTWNELMSAEGELWRLAQSREVYADSGSED